MMQTMQTMQSLGATSSFKCRANNLMQPARVRTKKKNKGACARPAGLGLHLAPAEGQPMDGQELCGYSHRRLSDVGKNG